jgi:hypothetical protein
VVQIVKGNGNGGCMCRFKNWNRSKSNGAGRNETKFKKRIMEAIIVLSSALLFRMIVWEDMKTYLFMLKCKRNVRHINKMFADLEKRIDEELRKQK